MTNYYAKTRVHIQCRMRRARRFSKAAKLALTFIVPEMDCSLESLVGVCRRVVLIPRHAFSSPSFPGPAMQLDTGGLTPSQLGWSAESAPA